MKYESLFYCFDLMWLGDPYCRSLTLSVCPSVCLSAETEKNVTIFFRHLIELGDF